MTVGQRRVAFCTPPHYGGIYSVFRRIRAAVADHGWEVMAVHPSSESSRWYGYDERLAEKGVVSVPVGEGGLQEQAKNLTRWFVENDVAIVIPMSLPPALAAIPHLPESIRVVTRCINVTPHAYRMATWGLPWIDRVVFTSPRQAEDLKARYRVDASLLSHVPNAVDVSRLAIPRTTQAQGQGLRLVFLDRLEHTQKRVLMLPELLERLDRDNVVFDIVIIGDGPDRNRLADDLQPWIARGVVRFVGAVPNDEVGAYLSQADVLVKMSRNEGFPSSVIEAMAAGVVPVVSHLRGVTDWIVRHEQTGLLCSLDNVSDFAAACRRLDRDRGLLRDMSEAASRDVGERFDIAGFGRNWSRVFEEVMRQPRRTPPLAWRRFRTPLPYRGTLAHRILWRHVPRSWKDRARAVAENLSVGR